MRKNKIYFGKNKKALTSSSFPRTFVTRYKTPSCKCGATGDIGKSLSVCGFCGTSVRVQIDGVEATRNL